jgi:prenyltransferase beta subunit
MPEPKTPDPISRRTLLKQAAAATALAAMPLGRSRSAETRPSWHDAVVKYLQSLIRKDGGFGWDGQPLSHLAPTYAAIGCHHLLGVAPPNPDGLARFVGENHPKEWKGRLEQEHREFEFQQIQSLIWLGADASSFGDQVAGWREPVPYMEAYERDRNPVFRFQLTAFTCRKLLGLPLDDIRPSLVDYLIERRRENGSFNHVPASDGSDGHVMNTLWGLEALEILGRTADRKAETVAWLQACQRPEGGFTYQPRPEFAGDVDLAYTWAAVKSLQILSAEPGDRQAAVRSVWSCWNRDGGFGDRPGWRSNAPATFYALETLRVLGALDSVPPADSRTAPVRSASLPPGLQVYTVLLEGHGTGSPADAVELARSLRIHLWGAKNAPDGWIARAQQLAHERNVPVSFFVANEEHGTWVQVAGLGTYSHTSDVIGPAGADLGSSLAGSGTVTWQEYRERRLRPLQSAGGRLIWQFGENEEIVRLFLDDSIRRGGYAAISTFHFGNPDFTNSEPFLNRYRGQIPFVALQDAHGSEPWWFSDMTTGFRTLFPAKEPTYAAWLEALEKNWTVAVRNDRWSRGEVLMHGGDEKVLDFVRSREDEWRWWNNPAIRRPMVSLVAVGPGDRFEAGVPETGLNLRVRTAWTNTTQGQPVEPISELVSLTVDGAGVHAEEVARRAGRNRNSLSDRYHLWQMANPTPGEHSATAVVRVLESGEEISQNIRFGTKS